MVRAVFRVLAGVWVSATFGALSCAGPATTAVKQPVSAQAEQAPRPGPPPPAIAPDAALSEAICTGDLAAVERKLTAGVSVDAVYEGCSLLVGAIGCSQPEVVKLLLERGANPSSQNAEGVTALSLATWSGMLDVVRLLLDHHVPVDEPTPDGHTALHQAAMSKRLDVMKLLLARGANPNAFDHDGFTPLAFAVNGDAVELIAVLLASGADPTLAREGTGSPLAGAQSVAAFELLRDAQQVRYPGRPATVPLPLILSLFKASDAAARACFERAKPRPAAPELWVSFEIEADGYLSKAEAVPSMSNVRDPQVIRCVLDSVRKLSFPRASQAASYLHHFTLASP